MHSSIRFSGNLAYELQPIENYVLFISVTICYTSYLACAFLYDELNDQDIIARYTMSSIASLFWTLLLRSTKENI